MSQLRFKVRYSVCWFLSLILIIQFSSISLFLPIDIAKAATHTLTDADCGSTLSSAGDTYQLTEDMTCTGHGLIIGADGITIDGQYNGEKHSITGDRSGTDYGIYNLDGHLDINVTNISMVSNFNIGIYIVNATENRIEGNTVNDNVSHGIRFENTSSSYITNNTVNSNDSEGIILYTSSSNAITDNTVNQNIDGIKLINTSTNNLISDNTANLNSTSGIFLWDSSTNTVIANNISTNRIGIHLMNADSCPSISNNTIIYNVEAIQLSSSTENTLSNNTIKNNTRDLFIAADSGQNTFSNNIMSDNTSNISDSSVNTYIANQFNDNRNINQRMFSFNEVDRTKNLNEQINFDIDLFDGNHNDCASCTYTLTTSPHETITANKIDNNITGNFVPSRTGTYSLILTIEDSSGNLAKRNFVFFVGATEQETTQYYLRETMPANGQPRGDDARSVTLSPPNDIFSWTCGQWVQNALDDIPEYPLSQINGIDLYTWYESLEFYDEITGDPIDNYMGVQRYTTYDGEVDSMIVVPMSASPQWLDIYYPDLNWAMDYPQSWYSISLKLQGWSPYWYTYPNLGEQNRPSYSDFHKLHTTTPVIKQTSNPEVDILSATASASDANNASIVMDATGLDSDNNPSNGLNNTASTNITLEDYHRPFLGYSTTISSDGTAILAANVTGQTTINSVDMDITPDAGNIIVNINTWNTSGDYSKQWTETGTGVNSASHIVSNLKNNTPYVVKVNGSTIGTYQSTSGQISFNYTGGYSTKTFTVTEQSTTISDTEPPTTSAAQSGTTVTLSASDSMSGVSKIYYRWGSSGSFSEYISPLTIVGSTQTLYYYSQDNTGNSEQVKTSTFTLPSIGSQTPSGGTASAESSSTSSRSTLPGVGSKASLNLLISVILTFLTYLLIGIPRWKRFKSSMD